MESKLWKIHRICNIMSNLRDVIFDMANIYTTKQMEKDIYELIHAYDIGIEK